MANSIVFEGVSKRFTLREEKARSLQELFLTLVRRGNRSRKESFWALRDVSFSLAPGETLGIIGENGAGKSTILKLISRIVEPTTGTIATDGRLASLLELGAGFHPDLTGRENIYLYGSILGLGRRDMRERFDDIIDFAEVDRFIDIPLKHYSSGMQVRLGFAIATTLDPDILLIDEVLAVGDEAFQKKCLARIADFQRQSKTIVFVSHNLDNVKRLCTRALWLEDGVMVADGDSRDVVTQYRVRTWEREAERKADGHALRADLQRGRTPHTARTSTGGAGPEGRWGTGQIAIYEISLQGPQGKPLDYLRTGDSLTVTMRYRVNEPVPEPVFGVAIYRADGLWCYGTNTEIDGITLGNLSPEGTVKIVFPQMDLLEGEYTLDVAVHDVRGQPYDYRRTVAGITVRSGIKDSGVFRPAHQWSIDGVPCAIGAGTEGETGHEA